MGPPNVPPRKFPIKWLIKMERNQNIVIIIIIIKAFIHLNILVTKHKIFTKIIFEMNGG
jgi:hypothetical protein